MSNGSVPGDVGPRRFNVVLSGLFYVHLSNRPQPFKTEFGVRMRLVTAW
jgi:hypothetical protein